MISPSTECLKGFSTDGALWRWQKKKKKTCKMFTRFTPVKISCTEFHYEIGKGSFIRSKRNTRKKKIKNNNKAARYYHV